MCPLYFIGYGIGTILFFLPDAFGRKKTMNYVLIPYIFSSYLTAFSHDIGLKSIGYFIQGLLHIKISNCYTHIYELVEDKYKIKAATIIGFMDEASIFIISCILKFVVNDIDLVFKSAWVIGTIACLIYMILVPESPKWLFLQDGTRSRRAMSSLNYIAMINGSDKRVPYHAEFDLIG